MPKSCDNYASIWEYSFRVMFEGSDSYVIVPLATFANSRMVNDNNVCAIYVEMLDATLADSTTVVFGQMFFSAIDMFSTVQDKQQSTTLTMNVNAINGTYLGSQAVNESSSTPFDIEPEAAPIASTTEQSSLPLFTASVTGITPDENPTWHIDFNAKNTVVWDSECQQFITEPFGGCDLSPTFTSNFFVNTTEVIGTFENKVIGGYVCSGNIYIEELCVGSSCKVMQLFAAKVIT